MDGTHGPDEARHHCEEEGEDGHQHASLAEPPEDSCQRCPLSSSSLQLVVPQKFEPGTRNQELRMTLLDQTSLRYSQVKKYSEVKDEFRLTAVHYTREDEAYPWKVPQAASTV